MPELGSNKSLKNFGVGWEHSSALHLCLKEWKSITWKDKVSTGEGFQDPSISPDHRSCCSDSEEGGAPSPDTWSNHDGSD